MPCRGCGKNSGRAVGEIGEALPVAEEASRFRGSAPIGGHDSDRKSVGTTVGNRRPLRKGCKRCGEVRNLPARASPCQLPLSKGTEGTGVRMSLLRCPKFLRCLTADAGNFDRGHSLTSLLLPLAALGSLPTASVRTGLAMTGFLQGVRCKAGRVVREADPYGSATRGAMGGRPQGSPLRRGYKECDAVRNPPFLRPFKIIFSSLLLSMQRMCFSGHR